MPFPQDQIGWLLANREKLSRYLFVPQLLIAALFLSFSYYTGKTHAHLLFRGARTRGTVIALKPVQITTHTGSSTSSSSSSYTSTIYKPLVEFRAGDRLMRFQEWKGSASSAGIGWSVPVIYDPADASIAMLDRGASNWLPWAPCLVIGLILALASLKGLFVFLSSS